MRKARTLPPEVGKYSGVVEAPAGAKGNNRVVGNAPQIGNFSTPAGAQFPLIPAIANTPTLPPVIGNFCTAFQTTGQTPTEAQYPVIPPAVAPAIGHFSTALQATGQTPALTQHPVIPALGNAPTIVPSIENFSLARGNNPTLAQYPMVSTVGNAPRKGPALEKHPTVLAALSKATAKSSTVVQPIKVFLKIASAGGKTQSVYQVLSPNEFREVSPVTFKNLVEYKAGRTAAVGKARETVSAMVPTSWKDLSMTKIPAVVPSINDTQAGDAAFRKPGKYSGTIPPDTPAVVASCEKNPEEKNAPVVSLVGKDPAVVSSEAPAVFPSMRKDPAVSPETPAAVSPETPAAVSPKAPAVFPARKYPAVVSPKAPAAYLPEETQVVVTAAVDEVAWRNSSSKESPRSSPHTGDSGDRQRRKRSRSRSSDSSGGDSLVHKKRRTTSPVKIKQEPTESDDKASNDENERAGGAAAVKQIDDSDDDDDDDTAAADWFF